MREDEKSTPVNYSDTQIRMLLSMQMRYSIDRMFAKKLEADRDRITAAQRKEVEAFVGTVVLGKMASGVVNPYYVETKPPEEPSLWTADW